MIQKKISEKHVLGAWQFDNGKARGMAIGSKPQGSVFAEGVVMLLSDDEGKVHLVINQDKLNELNGEIHIKNYTDPYESCGINGN